MTSLDVITMGCRLNTYESEVMRHLATEAGLKDLIIVNTCAVTQEAERKACQTIRKLSKARPGTPLVVTGCAAQINKGKFLKIPGVSLVLGNAEKVSANIFKALPALLDSPQGPQALVSDIYDQDSLTLPLISHYEGMAKAFIEIQNGCDHSCTFCTIPAGRGKNRSLPLGQLVSHVQHLVDKGFKEVSLTGVDITSFGHDLPGTPTLGNAVKRLLKMVPDLPRLRLSSLDPKALDDELFELFEREERLMPHAHLSIQSGNTLILKRMKRRHVRDDILSTCERLRKARPEIVLGADFIAGFPTESAEHFEDTLALIDEVNLTYLHVFPYSARPGTPASRMPPVPKPIISQRAALLRSQGKVRQHAYAQSLCGSTSDVLIESAQTGRTPGYAALDLTAPSEAIGKIQKVFISPSTTPSGISGTFV